MPETGAVFDLDGTLLPGTSAERLFIPYVLGNGAVRPGSLMRSVLRAASVPVAGAHTALRLNKLYLAGAPVARIDALVGPFVEDVLVPRLSPVLVDRIVGFLRSGMPVCILTGTLDVLADALARRMEISAGLGTRLEVRADRYTGRVDGPHYYGEVKLEGVDALAKRFGFDPAVSHAFGNHATDVPFLERFGFPTAVDPDAGLRRVATTRGWPVLEAARHDSTPPRAGPVSP